MSESEQVPDPLTVLDEITAEHDKAEAELGEEATRAANRYIHGRTEAIQSVFG